MRSDMDSPETEWDEASLSYIGGPTTNTEPMNPDEECAGDPSHQFHSHDDDPDTEPMTPSSPTTMTGRETDRRCIFRPCVATWKHYHGGFPGGYDNPEDPEGPPIPFTGPNPDSTAVRDYNGAALAVKLREEG